MFCWIRRAHFKTQWKGTYIKIHFRMTCSSKEHFPLQCFIIYQITRCHPPEDFNVNSEREHIISNEFTINFGRYKYRLLFCCTLCGVQKSNETGNAVHEPPMLLPPLHMTVRFTPAVDSVQVWTCNSALEKEANVSSTAQSQKCMQYYSLVEIRL